MNNLFSTFSPSSWYSLPLNWLAAFMVVMATPPTFWTSKPQSIQLINGLSVIISKEFKSILLPLSNPGMVLVPISLFLFIMLNNVFGLIPFVFTSSSHMTFTVGMAIPLWFGHMVYASLKTPSSMLTHLVPLGTPPALMPFMVIIEMVSSVIRPLTLSVRLAANMIAGHLLLSLLAGQANPLAVSLSLMVLSCLLLLCVLECAVSLIQAYVFSVLSTLYVNEVSSAHLN